MHGTCQHLETSRLRVFVPMVLGAIGLLKCCLLFICLLGRKICFPTP